MNYEQERGITITTEKSDQEWNTLEEFLDLLDKGIASGNVEPMSEEVFGRIESIKRKAEDAINKVKDI